MSKEKFSFASLVTMLESEREECVAAYEETISEKEKHIQELETESYNMDEMDTGIGIISYHSYSLDCQRLMEQLSDAIDKYGVAGCITLISKL